MAISPISAITSSRSSNGPHLFDFQAAWPFLWRRYLVIPFGVSSCSRNRESAFGFDALKILWAWSQRDVVSTSGWGAPMVVRRVESQGWVFPFPQQLVETKASLYDAEW